MVFSQHIKTVRLLKYVDEMTKWVKTYSIRTSGTVGKVQKIHHCNAAFKYGKRNTPFHNIMISKRKTIYSLISSYN